MTNTEKIFIMMLGTAMLDALSSGRCDGALTETEQRKTDSRLWMAVGVTAVVCAVYSVYMEEKELFNRKRKELKTIRQICL